MISDGDSISDYQVTLVEEEEITTDTLEDLSAGGPIVLAFFPAAFTGTCMNELETFRDRFPEGFGNYDLYAVSVDSPFVLQEVKSERGLPYPMISDFNRELIRAFDIEIGFEDLGIEGLAQRAVFAIDENREVTYGWVADDPGQLPPFDEVEESLASA